MILLAYAGKLFRTKLPVEFMLLAHGGILCHHLYHISGAFYQCLPNRVPRPVSNCIYACGH